LKTKIHSDKTIFRAPKLKRWKRRFLILVC
jgi:hypothetical protein